MNLSRTAHCRDSIIIETEGALDVPIKLKPGELRRIRTDWKEPASRVVIELKAGEGVKFDNLAYLHP